MDLYRNTSTTEMATVTDSSSGTNARDKDMAQILSNMEALQKRVVLLEQFISRHNDTYVFENSIEKGGEPENKHSIAKDGSDGIWREHGNNVGSFPNGESSNSYYAIENEGPASQRRLPEKYPADSYSMMVLNGPPSEGEWPLRRKIFFGVGLYVALMQIASLIILTCGALMDNSRAKLGGGNSNIVRVSQILSLSFYVIFPDASLHDFAYSLRYYPKTKEANKGDPVGMMKVACILRGFQGLFAVVPAWLLIMTADSVMGVLLSFASINVIANFDSTAFAIARTGAMGPVYTHEVERIEHKDIPPCFYREDIHARYWTGVGLLNITAFVAMLMAWTFDPEDFEQ